MCRPSTSSAITDPGPCRTKDPAPGGVFFCLTMTPARYFAGLRRSSMKQVYQGLTRVHHMPVLSET
ncbi:hypothetical protein D7Y22_00545 [Stenotrophomonas maltophilia]|nr:hypothetical protein [Stenotrophomonas maltophilia]